MKLLVLLILSLGAYCKAECTFEGTWGDELGATNVISFNGLYFDDQAGERYYADDQAVIHSPYGSTGKFQNGCKVILWSNGGTWLPMSSSRKMVNESYVR